MSVRAERCLRPSPWAAYPLRFGTFLLEWCFMARTENAGFRPKSYKTLRHEARMSAISQCEINDISDCLDKFTRTLRQVEHDLEPDELHHHLHLGIYACKGHADRITGELPGPSDGGSPWRRSSPSHEERKAGAVNLRGNPVCDRTFVLPPLWVMALTSPP